MRAFVGLLLIAATSVLLAGWLTEPVAAQQANPGVSNPYNLPETNLGAGSAQRRSGASAPRGFAHAPVPANPLHPEATAVGQQVCTACHQRENDHFTHTLHALGMNAAFAADTRRRRPAKPAMVPDPATSRRQAGPARSLRSRGAAARPWRRKRRVASAVIPAGSAITGSARSISATTSPAAIATTRWRSFPPRGCSRGSRSARLAPPATRTSASNSTAGRTCRCPRGS